MADKFIILLVFIFLSPSLWAQQSAVKQSRAAYNLGAQAYKAKDFNASQKHFEEALAFRPYHPGLMYTVAALQSLNGNSEDALSLLQEVADMGLVYPVAEDSDFDNIKETESFEHILEKMETAKQPVTNSQVAITLKEKDLVTESVAFDEKTGRFFISSIYKRKIVGVDKKGETADFIPEGDSGIWSIFSLRIDHKRNSLWANSSAMTETKNILETEVGQAGIFEFNLANGKLKNKFILKDSTEHIFGDFIFGEKNQIIVSDSKSSNIYVLNYGSGSYQAIYSSAVLASPQGLVLTPDKKHLLIADYSQGLFIFTLKTGDIKNIETAENICLLGIDGLYSYEGDLIAIQNGVRPNRVVRLQINSTYDTITSLEVLEANNPVLDDPTLGTIVGDTFYYIANSQWNAFGKDGIKPAEELNTPTVLKMRLD